VLTDDGLRLHVRTERRLVPGDAIRLRVDPSRLLVFPTDDSAATEDAAVSDRARRATVG